MLTKLCICSLSNPVFLRKFQSCREFPLLTEHSTTPSWSQRGHSVVCILQPSYVSCAGSSMLTCTSFNEWNTDTSVHSCCLQAVRAPQSTPLEEKHQLSAERDLVNQAPSSQWCSQTCINVRAEAEEERWTWRRSCGCKCIWWEKMKAAVPLTSMNNNLIWCYIFARLMWLISNTFTHTDSKQLFIRVLVKVEHPSNYGCLLVCKNNERLKQGKIQTVWNEMDGHCKTVPWSKFRIRLSEHGE